MHTPSVLSLFIPHTIGAIKRTGEVLHGPLRGPAVNADYRNVTVFIHRPCGRLDRPPAPPELAMHAVYACPLIITIVQHTIPSAAPHVGEEMPFQLAELHECYERICAATRRDPYRIEAGSVASFGVQTNFPSLRGIPGYCE